MSEKINTDHFSTMEELLEHLKKWERDDDIDAYYRFFSPSCAFELAHKIERQQKEIEDLKETNNDNTEKSLLNDIFIKNNYISKDKIREKINYYRKYCGYDGVTMIGNTQLKELEELLEEK